jgi:hypothetical protein
VAHYACSAPPSYILDVMDSVTDNLGGSEEGKETHVDRRRAMVMGVMYGLGPDVDICCYVGVSNNLMFRRQWVDDDGQSVGSNRIAFGIHQH